ncbi:MAG: phenylalanine--tRNA ligase subunit beta [Candidatus Dadabacteria bacterium]
MRFTLSWLKEYVEFNNPPEEIAERLTMVGLEVESIEYLGRGLEDIVVAQILDIRPHPNASRLVLCEVTDGRRRYNIVCGAKNMKSGDNVALARVGTRLPPSAKFPEGVLIQSARIRGETSEGMLCAENELGLGNEGEGILILPESARVGARLIDEMGLNDVVIDVGVTPNRPDCLSVLGISREVAAILGKRLNHPDYTVSEEGDDIRSLASVELIDSEGCPRYSCRVITDVTIALSPKWLKTRLETSGIRSINNVVDATNFVLLELGQPLHAFDYDLIEERKIVVRSAKDGESIETLDGVKRNLSRGDLLICDSQKPIAIAGVMGAANTEVSEGTRNILLESAYFNPIRVRRTSKRTNLRSESSYRFERGVDPNGVVKALDRASELIRGLSGGNVAKGRIDIYPNPIKPKELSVSTRRVNSVLGTEIESDRIRHILEGLEIKALNTKDGEISFRVPTFRVDITREIDLIEEIARHYGYNSIAATLPAVCMKTEGVKIEKTLEDRLKNTLTSLGFLEVINYSFEDPEYLSLFSKIRPLRILNPLNKEGSVMRTNLTAGILRNVIFNLNHRVQDIRIFEIGRVFIPYEDGLPEEIRKIAGAVMGRRQAEIWDKGEFDFFDLKGILERVFEVFSISEGMGFEEASQIRFLHPGKSAKALFGGEEVGFLGELHPEFQERLGISKGIYIFEIDLDRLFVLQRGAEKRFHPLPKFPSVRRDIALVVDEKVSVGKILDEIKKVESSLIEGVNVFDVFKGKPVGEGKKSVAVSMILRASDKTLTDEEANEAQTKVIKRLESALGAELRKI